MIQLPVDSNQTLQDSKRSKENALHSVFFLLPPPQIKSHLLDKNNGIE